MAFQNGNVPYSVVSVVLGSGVDENGAWEFRCTPAFAARWAFAKAYALENFGRPIFIRTGWNIYRPFNIQSAARVRACNSGNCAGASVAGYSSHGGNWQGRDCLAVDVDPNGLTWDQVDQAMESAGFSARLITQAMSGIPGGERWHYIDFNAFGPVPAFAGNGSISFDPEGFLMALSETQQRQMYEALVVGGPTAGAYYTPQALINIVRSELAPAIASIAAGGILYPGAPYLAFPAIANAVRAEAGAPTVDVNEAELAAALAPALAPLLIANAGTLTDETIAAVATALADEQARRLAS